jgi:hypothetical protein
MNTPSLDHEIERLNLLERTNDLSEYGKELITEYKAIKKALSLQNVSQQRELLLAYHNHLDSFNDPSIYNATEDMIDDYLANNCD